MIKTLSKKNIYKNKWIELWEDDVEFPGGQKGIYAYTTRIHEGPMIIPMIDATHVLILKEWRYPVHDWVYNFPGGEKEGTETMLEAAQRELLEETGGKAEEWIDLGSMQIDPSATTEVVPLFLARGISLGKQKHDANEVITSEVFSIDEIRTMIMNGKIRSMGILAAWSKFTIFQNSLYL